MRILGQGFVEACFFPNPNRFFLPVATQAVQGVQVIFPLVVASLAVSLTSASSSLWASLEPSLGLHNPVDSPTALPPARPSLGQWRMLPVGLVRDSPASDGI